jgi:glycerol-3-phosphate dehydrogenase
MSKSETPPKSEKTNDQIRGPMHRDLAALTDGTFDLLVLGGGITGAGIALDAATRGLRVALIDKGDFAGGTSSVSSKLVHGGLRYLEHGDFALVYEAMQERRRLLHNAPHLVWPLRFIIPFQRGSRVSPWKWRLGLTLYDALAGRDNLARSRPLSLAGLRREFPGLRSDGLVGGASYFDGQMDDARLCIEVLQTAARHGATLANYVEAVAFEQDSGVIRAVRAVDRLGAAELVVRARQYVNATGPWVDAVCRLAGEGEGEGDQRGPYLQPTKGVHIVVPDLGLQAAFLLLHPADGRVLFVIPWLGKTLIGTTDTLTPAGPDTLEVQAEEIAYLLAAYEHYFAPPLGTGDVLGSFVGLRPLIRARSGDPSALSREFRIFDSLSGLVSVAGGKYTTYRRMAELVTDVVVARLGMNRRCCTHDLLLDGTPGEPWATFVPRTMSNLRTYGLGDASAVHLLRRYGRRAADVAAYLERDPQLAQHIVPGEPDLRVEFVYQGEHEMAVCDEDLLLRRTRLGLFHRDLLAQALEKRAIWANFTQHAAPPCSA